jgi:hypothetical protein
MRCWSSLHARDGSGAEPGVALVRFLAVFLVLVAMDCCYVLSEDHLAPPLSLEKDRENLVSQHSIDTTLCCCALESLHTCLNGCM